MINKERSYTEYNVEVPTTDFPIGFDILDDGLDVVAVTLNAVDPTTLGYTVIQVNNTTYRFAPAVPSGVVRLTRITDIDQMAHVFTEGAIFISENMDGNFKQIRHAQQEVRDAFDFLEGNTLGVVEAAKSATELANTAAQTANDAANDAAAQVNDKIAELQPAIDSKLQEFDLAINTIVVGGGVPALAVSTAGGENQQDVNDYNGVKWRNKAGGYDLNARVMLTNGDIVKSTIQDNINNPNVDMTGWVKTNDSEFTKSPQFFGAKGGLVDDQSVFTTLPVDYAYVLGKEYTVPVWRTNATKFIGNGTKVNLDSVNGDTTVCLQIKPNSNYSDIDFVNNPNDAKAWTYSVIGNNSVLTNVGFYNFYDNAASKNSWGIYLEDRNNITLNSPKFGGNGLSDIAIVDNVKNITIVNAVNTVDPDGVILDIEPNNAGNIRNINVIGGKYAAINVLENSFITVGIQGLNIIGAEVGLLELRGGQTKLINSRVDRIKGNWANTLDFEGLQNEYFCSLEVDGFNLSQNLLEDEFLNSISAYDTNAHFSIYAPTVASVLRKKDHNGYYLSINANKVGEHVIGQRNFTALPAGADVICVAMSYSVENSAMELMFQPCIISFFNDSGVRVGAEYSLKGGRTAAGTNYNWSHEVSIFDIPSGATKCKIAVRSNRIGSTLKVRRIGVHTLTKTDGAGNFNAVVASYALPNLKNSYKQVVLPVDKAYGYDGLLVETLGATYKYVGSGNTFTLQLVEKVKVFGSASVNVSIPANTSHTETKTITGAKVGQTVSLSPNGVIGATVQLWGEVTAVDTVALYLRNTSATSASVVALLNIVLE